VGYIYIFATVLFTIYGQIVMKWRITLNGPLPGTSIGKLNYFAHMFTDFWVLSCFVGAFIAAVSWMAALTKFDVTYAYPFTSLGFVFVLVLGTLIFGEAMTPAKVFGVALIIAGIIVGSR
jgi:multidrug transporter EmrE-like cation transporter